MKRIRGGGNEWCGLLSWGRATMKPLLDMVEGLFYRLFIEDMSCFVQAMT